jgi:arginyl-tRNA synthetase
VTATKTIRQQLEATVRAALARAFPEQEELRLELSRPREKAFGDFATNAAMVAGKKLGLNPMDAARKIVEEIEVPSPLIASVDIKKPGFINIEVARSAYLEKLREIATFPDDTRYGMAPTGRGKKVQVEFVSANPTGPLNVVSARAAAVGDALVRLLRRTGYDVRSEFYINDSGTQVELLGESLKARFRQALGEKCEIPEGGYPGEYLTEAAEEIVPEKMLQSLAQALESPAGGTDDAAERERAAGFLPALEDEREHIDRFLEDTIAANPDERRNKRTYFDDYFAFREALEPEHVSLWMPLYVCHLSSLGLTFTGDMLDRLVWIERFRSYLRAQRVEGITVEDGGMMSAGRVFLGELVEGVGFDFSRFAVAEIVRTQQASLERFYGPVETLRAKLGVAPGEGLRFDSWFRESSLKHDVDEMLRTLLSDGRFVVEKEGAVWLKGGDEEDANEWVMRRSTGQPTYFLSDIAYHVNKRKRGFEQVIDIWGPDHHGHVGRMQTAMKVVSHVLPDLEIGEDWLRVLIAQQVNLIKDGSRVQMSKRSGEYVTLDDMVSEVGADVARFFFLMRRCNSHLDFDVDLAMKTSEENPVYYVQYAHARISSILEFARQNGYREIPPPLADLALLAAEEELEVIRTLAGFDELVRVSALALEPHRITTYLVDLAGKFHRFYHNHRVVTDDRALSDARLYLCFAVRSILRSALSLIGISAPDSM